MRTAALLASIVLLLASLPGESGAISRRKECRQTCGAAIDACVAAGGKRKRCKRLTLRQCRQDGVAVCTSTTTTTTTTIDGGSTSSTTTTPGGRGTTTTLGDALHGCTLANATDSTSPSANRTTTFSSVSFSYSPKCRRIAVGQSVLFVGQFSSHPLVGGEIVGSTETPDPASPLTNAADSGPNQKTAAFPSAGVFPFYCDQHGATFDMVGVVFVD